MITYPLTPTTQTLASLQAGGLSTIVAQIGSTNNLPALALQILAMGSYGASQAYQTADTAVTNFCTGQPVDLDDLLSQLDSARGVLAASAQAVADCSVAISANPGQLSLVQGSTVTSVGSGAQLMRTWPTPPAS